MTDTITSQNTDSSSWITVYTYIYTWGAHKGIKHFFFLDPVLLHKNILRVAAFKYPAFIHVGARFPARETWWSANPPWRSALFNNQSQSRQPALAVNKRGYQDAAWGVSIQHSTELTQLSVLHAEASQSTHGSTPRTAQSCSLLCTTHAQHPAAGRCSHWSIVRRETQLLCSLSQAGFFWQDYGGWRRLLRTYHRGRYAASISQLEHDLGTQLYQLVTYTKNKGWLKRAYCSIYFGATNLQ